jgi:hypothetical protein
LGRKTFALMQYWETDPVDEVWTPAEWEFARRWRGIDKVVVSSTLTHDEIGSGRVRLLRDLSLDELQRIVDGATGVVEIFGPTVAAPTIRAGLRALPDDVHLDLTLTEHRIIDNGTAQLRYAPG